MHLHLCLKLPLGYLEVRLQEVRDELFIEIPGEVRWAGFAGGGFDTLA
jgi:hypothetical protein